MTDNPAGAVKGYTAQDPAKVALVNGFKEDEERLLRKIGALGLDPGQQPHIGRDGRAYTNPLETELAVDPRMLAIARTELQTAFMWLNRAVFQPQRIKLPEDEAAK